MCLQEGLKLTLADIQTLLLDISLAVSDLQDNGVKNIVVKEETILVQPPQVGTFKIFCTNYCFEIFHGTRVNTAADCSLFSTQKTKCTFLFNCRRKKTGERA